MNLRKIHVPFLVISSLIVTLISDDGLSAGVDKGNPVSHENFKSSERKAFHGLCLAVVQSKLIRGTISLSAESEGLQSAEIIINVK